MSNDDEPHNSPSENDSDDDHDDNDNPSSVPLDPAMAAKQRRDRLEQNRISARESRKRKKTMIEELQRTVITLSKENKELNERNETLRRELVEIGTKHPSLVPIQALLKGTTSSGDAGEDKAAATGVDLGTAKIPESEGDGSSNPQAAVLPQKIQTIPQNPIQQQQQQQQAALMQQMIQIQAAAGLLQQSGMIGINPALMVMGMGGLAGAGQQNGQGAQQPQSNTAKEG